MASKLLVNTLILFALILEKNNKQVNCSDLMPYVEFETPKAFCCRKLVEPSSKEAVNLLQIHGNLIQYQDPDKLIGIGCVDMKPVSLCLRKLLLTAQPVCCNGNSFNGLVILGCSPINLRLDGEQDPCISV